MIVGWYDGFAASLTGHGGVPAPLERDALADGRLVKPSAAICSREDGRASATAARMIWTGDHLDAARRLQGVVVEPAQTANRLRTTSALDKLRHP